MQGQTHRVGGVLCCLVGYTILENKGMLINDVNPLVQLAVLYPFALYGSTFSDLDHNWNSAPNKDIVSWCVNKIFHLTTGIRKKMGRSKSNAWLGLFDAKHRSWQTHSDLFFAIMLFIAWHVINSPPDGANGIILKLILIGFCLGLVSHLLLDMLTPEGIWSIPFSIIFRKKVMLHLVPRSKFFATGGSWEKFVRYTMWVFCFILLVRIGYLASPYRLSISF